jgi:hypothetical protein
MVRTLQVFIIKEFYFSKFKQYSFSTEPVVLNHLLDLLKCLCWRIALILIIY